MNLVYRYKSGAGEYMEGPAYVCIGCLLDESAHAGNAFRHYGERCRLDGWPHYKKGHDKENSFRATFLMERREFEDEKDLRAHLLDCLRRHREIQEDQRNFWDWLRIYHPERFPQPVVEYTVSGDQSGGGVLLWDVPERSGKQMSHEEEFAGWKAHVGNDWRAVLDRLLAHYRAWETPSLARAIAETRGANDVRRSERV